MSDPLPRSITTEDGNQQSEYDDQIAWFDTEDDRRLNMAYLSDGGIDFVDLPYKDVRLRADRMLYRIADHYPRWMEFSCRT